MRKRISLRFWETDNLPTPPGPYNLSQGENLVLMSDHGEGVGEECQSCPLYKVGILGAFRPRKASKVFSSNATRKRAPTIPGLLNNSKILIPFTVGQDYRAGEWGTQEVLCGEAPPRGPTPQPFRHYFFKKLYPSHIPCLELDPFNRKCTVLKV